MLRARSLPEFGIASPELPGLGLYPLAVACPIGRDYPFFPLPQMTFRDRLLAPRTRHRLQPFHNLLRVVEECTVKPQAVHTILTARILLDCAHSACMVDDRHTASAGLVMLQDAVELFLCACLLEKGEDEKRSLGNLKFSELISALKKAGVRIIKSGTLNAMNKQRVIVKHYGQLAEPTTVRQYFEAAQASLDDLLQQVFGKRANEILLCEIIKNDEVRRHLKAASECVEAGKFFAAVVEVRKAIFIEVEEEYCIDGWKDTPLGTSSSLLSLVANGGFKAPSYCKSKEWIEENVREPFDYIQLDHERARLDLLEWGVGTQDFWNVRRLTPSVFREAKHSDWLVEGDFPHLVGAATEANARYCLDRAYALMLKKQQHQDLNRYLKRESIGRFRVRFKSDLPLFEKADTNSRVVDTLPKGRDFSVERFVPGLSEPARFARILDWKATQSQGAYAGYVVYDDTTCELIDLWEQSEEKG